MPTQVVMPQLGESVVEGTITKWLKAAGESVEENEPLVEVNTDKVDTEVPSPASGVLLEILAPEGTTVQAGRLLARIGAAGEASSTGRGELTASEPAARQQLPVRQCRSPATPVPAPAAPAGRSGDLGFISPVVARMASDLRINLTQVTGTGQGGRITKKDLLAYIERRRPGGSGCCRRRQPASPATAAAAGGCDRSSSRAHPSQPPAGRGGDRAAQPGPPPDRRAHGVQQAYLGARHHHHGSRYEPGDGAPPGEQRGFRSRWGQPDLHRLFRRRLGGGAEGLPAGQLVLDAKTGIQLHRAINIGMATSLGEAGLIVPVIKNADSLSLLGLARAVNDLANRARNRQLKPDEVQGGTFTITNHGISGSLFATPIINQPQCAILGVGIIQKRVVVVSDEQLGDVIAIRPMVYLGLTFDHRILDGAIADNFLGKVVETLQKWGCP